MNFSSVNIFFKRAEDIGLSFVALILLSPVLLGIALAVKLDSKGPVLFRQGRLTKDGKVFRMLKFRTMVENAENMGTGLFSFENDARVTKIGNLLRRISLDELPQLYNVLVGEMTLVGPRPPVSYELGKYEDLSVEQRKRFTVPQGITGLAQISGRNELPWEEKIKFDNQYVDLFTKYGVLIDLKILMLTIIHVFTAKDTYEVKDKTLADCTDEEIALKAKKGLLVKDEAKQAQKDK